MEDNIAKLVQIVGGVLIGVILLALVSNFFSSISSWPEEEDSLEAASQLAAFNLEYEVYDKKGMYGVDVISCLNKAKSNNEKYAEGGAFLADNMYGKDFYVDVYIKLTNTKKKYLQESLEIYYMDKGQQRQFFSRKDPETNNDITKVIIPNPPGNGRTLKMGDSDVGFFQGNESPSKFYTTFNKNTELEPLEVDIDTEINGIKPIQVDGGEFPKSDSDYKDYNGNKLVKYYSLRDDKNLAKLLELSTKSENGNLTRTVYNRTGANLDIWSMVVWKTALYDLKSRKFKCDMIHYSEKTGRVDAIAFSEI